MDDFGVMIHCAPDAVESIRVPLSPGLYGNVGIKENEQMDLGQTYVMHEPGILAFDGDRTIQVETEDTVEVSVRRDGPWIIDPEYVMSVAAQHGLMQ